MVEEDEHKKFWKKNKMVLQLGAVLGGTTLIYLCLALTDQNSIYYLFAGGAVGAASSVFVIFDIFSHKRKGAIRLVLWRAVADLGIAVRFLFTSVFNNYTCGNDFCAIDWTNTTTGIYTINQTINSGSGCNLPSAFLEFFEIASEAWFFLIALDLIISLRNPFASTESR